MKKTTVHREARLELRNVENGIACFLAKVQDDNCFAALYVKATSEEMTTIIIEWLQQLPAERRSPILAQLNREGIITPEGGRDLQE